MSSYKDLIVWQKSYQLTLAIYSITKQFPKDELFGLTSQMRRSSVSLPSNIAEGNARFSKKDHLQFIRVAYGSGAELETQIYIAKSITYMSQLDFGKTETLLEEVMKMLNSMIRKLKPRS